MRNPVNPNKLTMKTSTNYLILAAVVIFTTVLLSWNRVGNPQTETSISNASYLQEMQDLSEFEMGSSMAEDPEFFSPESRERRVPPAEDVLVQRIPGDNNHLLIMAFYSKENYSGASVKIKTNGSQLVFTDDGKGDDKIAGDGFYTAKINVNVSDFRKMAVGMAENMKKIITSRCVSLTVLWCRKLMKLKVLMLKEWITIKPYQYHHLLPMLPMFLTQAAVIIWLTF